MDDIGPDVQKAAECVWQYMLLNMELVPADAIMVLGSNDLRVADRGAELYHAKLAPIVLLSGGVGVLTEGVYGKSEAEAFADRCKALGVPEEAILIESASTNTGENITLSRKVLEKAGILEGIKNVIVVQKPFMERRSYATFRKQWPDSTTVLQVTSPVIPFSSYADPSKGLSTKNIIDVMCGDLQRIAIYPRKGFQVEQPIPQSVWDALHILLTKGFSRHLLKDTDGQFTGLRTDVREAPECVLPDDEYETLYRIRARKRVQTSAD